MKKVLIGGAVASLLVSALTAPAFATTSTTNTADISNSNAFVRNSWVQAGLKENGTFGSTADAPAGYNPSSEQSPYLGLVADPEENGFGTGVDHGDFFLPGSPYEGWGIRVSGGTQSYRNDDSDSGITGSWTTSEESGDASATWVADADTDGIGVTQVVSAPANGDHLIHVNVALKNNTGSSKTVYYTRQVDPDNDKDFCQTADPECTLDGYDTFNSVLAQSDASSIVVGRGFNTGSLIGYRTSDPSARVRISDWSWPLSPVTDPDNNDADITTDADMAAAYDSMRSDYKVGYQDFVDSTIDILFKKTIAAGATATIDFDYILSTDLVDAPEYALDLALDMSVGSPYADTPAALVGGGLKPDSEFTLTQYSTPTLIFTGTTLPNGNFYDETTLPTECIPGEHHLVLEGIAPNGTKVSDYVTYTVDADCIVTAFNPYAAADDAAAADLAATGANISQASGFAGIVLAISGALAVVVSRRRKARA